MDKLNLYCKVIETVGSWRSIPWLEIPYEIDKMIEIVEGFGRDRGRLPGVLKRLDAYKELKLEVDSMAKFLPLVKELSKESIKDRHWMDIIKLTQKDIPYKSEAFTLNQLFETNLLEFETDIEDITESADKQLKLGNDLDGVIAF